MPVYCITYGCDNDQCNASPIANTYSLSAIKEGFAVKAGKNCH